MVAFRKKKEQSILETILVIYPQLPPLIDDDPVVASSESISVDLEDPDDEDDEDDEDEDDSSETDNSIIRFVPFGAERFFRIMIAATAGTIAVRITAVMASQAISPAQTNTSC